MTMKIVDAHEKNFLDEIRSLFAEYAESLGTSLDFQNFDQELAGLPGDYVPPEGALLLAIEDEKSVGCIAMRKLGNDSCEMKRLFVRPAWRDAKLGRVLAEAIIDRAKKSGYKFMRLDTLPTMDRARMLYKSLGFYEIDAYRYNPIPGTAYMELKL
jgi:ribosomal protein S18 acetylase RimI-like enzyme